MTGSLPAGFLEWMNLSDGEIVARVREGRTELFEVLVERHQARCLRYAYRMLGVWADAEDVVQETFIRCYRSLHRYRDDGRFPGWLFTILVNQCRTSADRTQRRELRRERHGALSAPVRGTGQPSFPEPRDPFLAARVRRALETLQPAMREALLLRDVEQMGYAEMARVTGQGVSALKMRVARGRARLRVLLDGVADDRPGGNGIGADSGSTAR